MTRLFLPLLLAFTAVTSLTAQTLAPDTFLLKQRYVTDLESAMNNPASTYKVMFTNMGGVPEELSQLPNLKCLIVNGNDWDYNLKELPPSIGNLKTVEQFYMYNTDVQTLPAEITGMKNLKYGSFANITSVPAEMSGLSQLEVLEVPMVGEIPSSFSKLPKLKVLHSGVGTMPVIKTLEELTTAPQTIISLKSPQDFTSLRKLVLYLPYNFNNDHKISADSLNTLMKKISSFPQLKELDLSAISLRPEDWKIITSMTNLTSLTVSETIMPASIAGLVNLQTIGFYPEDAQTCIHLSKIPALKTAVISGAITPHLAKLKELQSIKLKGVSNMYAPEVKVLAQLPALKELIMSDVSIRSLDNEIKTLTSLETIDLSGAHGIFHSVGIKQTIEDLALLPNLKTLKLIEHQLIEDPMPQLDSLKKLEKLTLYLGEYSSENEAKVRQALPAGCKLEYAQWF